MSPACRGSDRRKAAWFESASFRAYAAVGSPEQARALSEACGEHGILIASDSTSESRGSKLLSPATRSTGTQRAERPRRLVTPSEILADARSDEQLVFVTGRKPLRCGRALYFRRPEMIARVGAVTSGGRAPAFSPLPLEDRPPVHPPDPVAAGKLLRFVALVRSWGPLEFS